MAEKTGALTKTGAIMDVVKSCGGTANLEQIYEALEKDHKEAATGENWKAVVRGILYHELKKNKAYVKVGKGIYALAGEKETGKKKGKSKQEGDSATVEKE